MEWGLLKTHAKTVPGREAASNSSHRCPPPCRAFLPYRIPPPPKIEGASCRCLPQANQLSGAPSSTPRPPHCCNINRTSSPPRRPTYTYTRPSLVAPNSPSLFLHIVHIPQHSICPPLPVRSARCTPPQPYIPSALYYHYCLPAVIPSCLVATTYRITHSQRFRIMANDEYDVRSPIPSCNAFLSSFG